MTLIAGDLGLGKSALTAFMAAKISQGKSWPDAEHCAPKGQVLIVSAEDSPEATILPRLKVAGADIDAVHVLLDPPDLVRNFQSFEEEASAIPDLKLIVIDPLSACMGGTDPNQTPAARGVMTRLSHLAGWWDCAIVCILHLSKGGRTRNPLAAIAGSNALGAAARMAHLVCSDPADPARRLLLQIKNNLGPEAPGLAFHVDGVWLPEEVQAPVITFDATLVDLCARGAAWRVCGIRGANRTRRGRGVFLSKF